MVEGRVMTASEVYPLVPEGRDAVRAAFRELVNAGHIIETRYRTNSGRFEVDYQSNQAWKSVCGKPGDLSGEIAVPVNSTNSYKIVEELTNVSSTTISCKHDMSVLNEEEFVEMPWPGFETPAPAPKTKRREPEPDTGAVGKLTDKVTNRNAKYKKTKFEAVPASMLRNERPEDQWTTADLVAEFYDLTREAAPGTPSQVNGAQFAKWINRMVGEGVPRSALLKAIRAFFRDPRLLRDVGVGNPLWRRFVAFYPTVHGIYTRDVELEYDDDDFKAHQAKMLSLLEDK